MLKTDFPLRTRWTKFTLPSEKTTKSIVYIKKIVFKTLDIRQQRTVIPVIKETNDYPSLLL